MGGEPLEYGSDLPEHKKSTFTEFFEEMCPYFMSIGVTYKQFWNGDVYIAKNALKAHRIQNKRDNQKMWMQGKYFNEALTTSLANLFKKKGTPPHQYLSEPYPLDEKEVKEREERELKLREQKIIAAFKARAEAFNSKLASKQKKEGGQ